jgi:hypothetical protein
MFIAVLLAYARHSIANYHFYMWIVVIFTTVHSNPRQVQLRKQRVRQRQIKVLFH